MRLHGQTAKIEGGFVLFPKEAPWLDAYINELIAFPNAKNDDQVDSTVFALAWSTISRGGAEAWILHYRNMAERWSSYGSEKKGTIPVYLPPPSTTYSLISGREITVPENRIVEMTEDEFIPLINLGGRRVD
jgi:hypothetical protein